MNLSRVLLRNAGTKLLALAIAAVTWFLLTGVRRERISERNYRVPLSIVNVPRGTMVVSPLPDAVDVRVRGALTPLRTLDPARLEAVVDLADATPGEKRYPLEPGDINVPSTVEVIGISPGEIRVVLDEIAEKKVPVVASVVGSPADGARMEDVAVDPKNVHAVGPARVISALENLPTQPISLEGRPASFAETTTLALPAPGVRVREGQAVSVQVRIRPAPTPEPTVRPAASRPKKGTS
jgi:YbbR domain-containing protein